MKKINIVNICFLPKGGAGLAAYRLHEELVQGSNKVNSIFVCADFENTKDSYKNLICVKKRKLKLFQKIAKKLKLLRLADEKFRKACINKSKNYEIITWPETEYRVEDIPEVISADIIHLHWVSGFLNYPTFFKKLTKQKIVWTFHDMNPFLGIFHYLGDQERNINEYGHLDNLACNIKNKSIGKRLLNIVTLSSWIESEAKKRIKNLNVAYTKIENGINFDLFNINSKEYIRAKLGLNLNDNVILTVAQDIANYRKGVDILVDALNNCKVSDLCIVLCGNGSIELPENIKYINIGSVASEDIVNIYSLADVFIIPSREDNLPNVMLESFACGIPVICLPNGGTQEWIINGVNGFVSNDCTPLSLAEAIDLFFANKMTFSSEKIRDFGCEYFDIKKQMVKFENMYEKIHNSEF